MRTLRGHLLREVGGVVQSADHNPDGERNQQETQRQQLLLPHDLKPPHRKPCAFLIDRTYTYNNRFWFLVGAPQVSVTRNQEPETRNLPEPVLTPPSRYRPRSRLLPLLRASKAPRRLPNKRSPTRIPVPWRRSKPFAWGCCSAAPRSERRRPRRWPRGRLPAAQSTGRRSIGCAP